MFRLISASVALQMLAVVAVGSFCGCGDVDTFKVRSGSWGDKEPPSDWEGTIVELTHVTMPCDDDPEGLRAFVGAHLEFENCAALATKSVCSADAGESVAIDVQARSIVFDFSNVVGPGVFGPADFNGYVIADLVGRAPELIGATVDRRMTTLDLDDQDIVIDGSSVHANFAGLTFEDSDFVKVDLVFEEMEAP